ncbi:hypothetical protein PBI_SCTP2_190 [Salicola phage SCTP-2]|nr:hypothetical protein PBI_SCTP2_190 [Salicola phage SCTP-2]
MDNYEKLLKLMEYVDIDENEDGLYINIKNNVLINNNGHLINKIKGSFVLVTDTQNQGMIYLNPNHVSYYDKQTINQICKSSFESLRLNENKIAQNHNNCSKDDC